MPDLSWRVATVEDEPGLRLLMDEAIGVLQLGFLTPEQIEASRRVMGLDRQLVEDGTYFVVFCGGVLAGCGGWSWRATLFGGDHTLGRDAAVLDPGRDAARVRAMYTAPGFARRGVGRLILGLCEAAAAGAGFRRVQLAATLAGVPLYRVCGYREDGPIVAEVPLVAMSKALVQAAGSRS